MSNHFSRFGSYLLGLGIGCLLMVALWTNSDWPGWTGVVAALGVIVLGGVVTSDRFVS